MTLVDAPLRLSLVALGKAANCDLSQLRAWRGCGWESRDAHSRAQARMTRTLAIAIVALLYVLAVGHAHHASVDHAPVLLGGAKH